MFGIDSFNSTPVLPLLNMPSHSFILKSENKKTFNAPQTEEELTEGYSPATDSDGSPYTLYGIMDNYCPDIGADEVCSAGPFTQFTIRGTGGIETEHSDARWYFQGLNTLVLKDYDNEPSKKSGAVEIDIRNGYQVKLQIELTNSNHGKDFKEDHWGGWGTNDTDGVLGKGELTTTVLMKGGDKLSIDIDDKWGGTTKFYLKVQGNSIVSSDELVNDQVKITLLGVWAEGGATGGGTGGSTGGGTSGGTGGDNTEDSTEDNTATDSQDGLGMGTIALLGIAVVGAVILLR